MCRTPLHSNKHKTICAGHHYTQTNTRQYVPDTTTLKQTQDNMCRTPLHSNKHNTICAGHHYTQTNTRQYVPDTTTLKQTQAIYESSDKLEAKTNQTSFLCGNRNVNIHNKTTHTKN